MTLHYTFDSTKKRELGEQKSYSAFENDSHISNHVR